jgi:asparagine synthetase B (glutamine-hydrolysing)
LDIELGEGGHCIDGGDGLTTVVAGTPRSTAVWDPSARTLRLVRDHTGRHPLFHARVGGTLLASTDARALLSEPGVSRTASAIAVAEFLLRRPGPPTETLVAALSRVPAGHVFTLDASGERLTRVWVPPHTGSLSIEEAGRFGEMLERAVAAALDGRAAVFLSGGIDSTAVAAATTTVSAARGLPTPIAACADIEGSSEVEIQRTVARALGMERVGRAFSPAEGELERALELSRALLWPVNSPWVRVYHQLLADALAAGCRVLLDGVGGDELLDVGVQPARTFLRRGHFRALRDLARAERVYRGRRLPHIVRVAVGRGRPPVAEPAPAWIADPALRQELDARQTASLPADDLLDTVLAAQAEAGADMAIRGGYRHVQPLLDADVVKLVRALPPEALVSGGDPKSPARAYVRERVSTVPGRWPRPAVVMGMLDRLIESGASRAWNTLGGSCELVELGLRSPDDSTGLYGAGLEWGMLSMEQWLQSLGAKL